MSLNRSPVLVHQSYSVEGNDLNPSVEGNQACLFCSIVFERITRPYPLPPPHTNIFYITNIKALCFVVSEKFFSCHPYIILYKTCDPGAGPFLTPVALFEQTW